MTDEDKLNEIERRCIKRIEIATPEGEEYNRNMHPAWILVDDVLNIIHPSTKYSNDGG